MTTTITPSQHAQKTKYAHARSQRGPRLVLIGLSLVGLIVAGWMAAQGSDGDLSCSWGSCSTVTSSSYGTVAGIPLAFFGLGYFIAMFAVSMQVWRRGGRWRTAQNIGVSSGVLVVIVLVWIELVLLEALCLWCTSVHLIVVAMVMTNAFDWALAPNAEHGGFGATPVRPPV